MPNLLMAIVRMYREQVQVGIRVPRGHGLLCRESGRVPGRKGREVAFTADKSAKAAVKE